MKNKMTSNSKNKQIIGYCNASKVGLGCLFMQKGKIVRIFCDHLINIAIRFIFELCIFLLPQFIRINYESQTSYSFHFNLCDTLLFDLDIKLLSRIKHNCLYGYKSSH